MKSPLRFDVVGVGVDALTLPQAVARIVARAKEPGAAWVICRDLHGVIRCRDDATLAQAHAHAFLVTPDGMPLVWWGRLVGQAVARVYGPDLLTAVSHATHTTGQKHLFFGGAEGVAEALANRMRLDHPGLNATTLPPPPFRELNDAEVEATARQIAATEADFIWIGLSTPRQEKLMARLAPHLERGVLLGIGAAFDFYTGRVRQAPRWVQRSGLEWLFRILQEPARLAPRYARTLPRFAWLAFRQMIGRLN